MHQSVEDIMTKKLVTFRPDTNVLEAINTLLKHKISGAPVVDEEGNIVGILSEIDCMETLIQDSYYHDARGSVSEFMSKNITTADVDMGIVDLAEFFVQKHFRRLPVTDHGKLVGQVSRRDVLKAIQ
ncbi:MAG: CBS domain-containing protein [Candidatus Marinimicrobia bacterium]|jgi:CBS domain-containing protein|nr:CBS domain-containing protein [Candidatus Neomarinimicrobiota bacterium]MDP6611450.1 CBS domain-containing protein [Candidatus Neomarinimicrobiota bacterium]|tara:strand:+ start:3884 stop:4264 length:381 start_codon:yes stop_codon:yes gene_type:complete